MTSKKEEEWYKKFQEGTFLVKGWKSRMKELLRGFDDSDKASMGDLLANLGEKIGREWSKDNEIRRIDTTLLQQWGENLRTAKKDGRDGLKSEIRKIDAEVDDILT